MIRCKVYEEDYIYVKENEYKQGILPIELSIADRTDSIYIDDQQIKELRDKLNDILYSYEK